MGILQKFYNRINWKNRPSMTTALGETNLNHMDSAINELDNRIVTLSANKAEVADLNKALTGWTIDPDTWVITTTLKDGTTTSFDLPIEQVVVNFDIDDDNQLVLTLEDGSRKTVDLTRYVYSVGSTPTVAMTITDRVITAKIVDGSITMGMLEAGLKSELMGYRNDAQTAAGDSLTYSKDAKRWAVGDPEYAGSDTDNSKYYKEQSENYYKQIQAAASIVIPEFHIDLTTGELMSDQDAKGYRFWIDDNGYFNGEVVVNG